jgi:hypothetical protein
VEDLTQENKKDWGACLNVAVESSGPYIVRDKDEIWQRTSCNFALMRAEIVDVWHQV